ncbi:DUF4236 domain-containing protein [Calidithermus chliarophilus]
MGFGFRKSVKMGPFRVNLSKSGIGVSFGLNGPRPRADDRSRTGV